MKQTTTWIAAAIAGTALALCAPAVWAEATKTPAGTSAKPAESKAAARTYATPEDAVKALVDAVRAANPDEIVAVIGPKSRSWLSSGDKVSDTQEWKDFLAAYEKKSSVTKQGESKALLRIGDGDWWFPAPLVSQAGKWSFDAKAGGEEVMNRRIGRNELDTIQALLAVVDAQREYALGDADKDGLHDYAARFRSTPGKKDGLYWETGPGEPRSPLGPLVAKAVREGYGAGLKSDKPQPYNGYRFRMLTAQGKHAPGGAYPYLVGDKLFGGFAVVAWPASYGNSGMKTFLVNHDGVVWEKDLGAKTAELATRMKLFDPDKTWAKVQ